MSEVCIDAAIALRLVRLEPERERVRTQWAVWLQQGVTPVSPWLWAFESHAVLRRKVSRGELIDQRAREAWRTLQRQGIHIVHPRGLFERAWALAAVARALASSRSHAASTSDSSLAAATQG